MEITPRELRDVEIKESLRGYNRDEVNDLLERAAASLDAANERVRQFGERLTSAQTEAGRTRETEDILHRTLLLAQRAADEAVAEATQKARQMVDDAEIQSRRVIAEAEAEARRRGENERSRLEEEIVDLAGRRDALLADVETLTRFETDYRDRMTRALEADLTALRTRPSAAPANRPEPADVDLPVMPEAFAAREPNTAPAAASEPGVAAAGELPSAEVASVAGAAIDTGSTPIVSDDAALHDSRELPAVDATIVDDSGDAAAPTPTDAPANASAGAPLLTAAAETWAGAGTDAETREVDVRSLFEADASAPVAAAVPDAPPAAENPIDLLGAESLQPEVLDDEAFFATLREAVHDDAPLGPRDENDITGDNRFFDQDADRSSFRDVFRRRR